MGKVFKPHKKSKPYRKRKYGSIKINRTESILEERRKRSELDKRNPFKSYWPSSFRGGPMSGGLPSLGKRR